MIEPSSWITTIVERSPKLQVHARAHRARLLGAELREIAAEALEKASKQDFDLSFFDNEAMLELIPAVRLVHLGISLRNRRLAEIEDQLVELSDEADLDEDPEIHFKKIADALDRLEKMGVDDDGGDLIEAARDQIKRSIEALEEKRKRRDEESENEADWTHIVAKQVSEATPSVPQPVTRSRSTFDDVDK